MRRVLLLAFAFPASLAAEDATARYAPHQQALVSSDGHSCDRFEVEHEGKSSTLYFLADRVLAAEAALFQPK